MCNRIFFPFENVAVWFGYRVAIVRVWESRVWGLGPVLLLPSKVRATPADNYIVSKRAGCYSIAGLLKGGKGYSFPFFSFGTFYFLYNFFLFAFSGVFT